MATSRKIDSRDVGLSGYSEAGEDAISFWRVFPASALRRLSWALFLAIAIVPVIEAGLAYRVWRQITASIPLEPPGTWIYSAAGTFIEPFRRFDTSPPRVEAPILDLPALVALDFYLMAGLLSLMLAMTMRSVAAILDADARRRPRRVSTRRVRTRSVAAPAFAYLGQAYRRADARAAAFEQTAAAHARSQFVRHAPLVRQRSEQTLASGRSAYSTADAALAFWVRLLIAHARTKFDSFDFNDLRPSMKAKAAGLRAVYVATDAVLAARARELVAYDRESSRARAVAFWREALAAAHARTLRFKAWGHVALERAPEARQRALDSALVLGAAFVKSGPESGRWLSQQALVSGERWFTTARSSLAISRTGRGEVSEKLSRRDFLRLALPRS